MIVGARTEASWAHGQRDFAKRDVQLEVLAGLLHCRHTGMRSSGETHNRGRALQTVSVGVLRLCGAAVGDDGRNVLQHRRALDTGTVQAAVRIKVRIHQRQDLAADLLHKLVVVRVSAIVGTCLSEGSPASAGH